MRKVMPCSELQGRLLRLWLGHARKILCNRHARLRFWSFFFSSLMFCIALSGCAIKRSQYDVPRLKLPQQYQFADAVLAEQHHASAVEQTPFSLSLDQWWLLLESEELNRLVERALQENHDIKIAEQRMAQAHSRAVQAGAARWPELNLPVQSKIEAPANGLGSVPAGGSIKTQRTYEASVRLDWQLDVWGEKQAGFESTQMQWWRAVYLRDDAKRLMLGNLVSSYVEYLSLNDRIHVAEETARILDGMLTSVQQRYDRQDATITELEQQRAAVFAVRATLPGLLQQKADVSNNIQFLVGAQSTPLVLSELGLASLKVPEIGPVLPSQLLLRRPDIRVMEARLLSADADIDVARAQILPRIDLSAQYGVGSHVLSELFAPQARLWSALANLSANIFDAGNRRAEVDYARSVHQEMLETYMRVVYGAIREVNAAMAGLHTGQQRIGLQQLAVESSFKAWQYSKQSWQVGAIDYLSLLDTERSYHRNFDELLRIKQERFRAMINLFQALGGGVGSGPALPGKGTRPQDAILLAVASPQKTVAKDAAQHDAVPQAEMVDHKAVAGNASIEQAHDAPASQLPVEALVPPSESSVVTDSSTPTQPNPAATNDGLAVGSSALDTELTVWVAGFVLVKERKEIAEHWRQLRSQYPALMQEKFVVARSLKKGLALYLGNFSSIEDGQNWCEQVKQAYPTCQILPSQAIGGANTRLRMSLDLTTEADTMRGDDAQR